MFIEYTTKRFNRSSLEIIDHANEIIADYDNRGLMLTLRQLYYQFVARGYIENTERSYKRIGNIISDARLAGLLSWTAIEDRTRNLSRVSTWDSPSHIMGAVIKQFKLDKWANQPNMVEVWVEKEALSGVVEQACRPYQTPYFACRGYVSQSEMWRAAERFYRYAKEGKDVYVLHLGDHDPSGIDMTRDIMDRLETFEDFSTLVEREALNFNQIEELQPPPNPAKTTDSRFKDYKAKYGEESWELDALDPQYLIDLIQNYIDNLLDRDLWNEGLEQEKKAIATLEDVEASIDEDWEADDE